MRYCPSCLEEYEDSVKTCAECDKATVTEAELAERPEFKRIREDDDPRSFVVIGPAEDPFEADAFTAAISDAGIPVLARMRHGGSVDKLTESTSQSWWEILVADEDRQKAAEVMARRKEELAASEQDAEAAAEAEELEGEKESGKA
jgi:hypothetical protein